MREIVFIIVLKPYIGGLPIRAQRGKIVAKLVVLAKLVRLAKLVKLESLVNQKLDYPTQFDYPIKKVSEHLTRYSYRGDRF